MNNISKIAISLLTLLCALFLPVQDTPAAQTELQLAYDLLILSRPNSNEWVIECMSDEGFNLRYLDTASETITTLPVEYLPVSRNALSPDGAYIVAMHNNDDLQAGLCSSGSQPPAGELCLLDNAWEMQWCMPSELWSGGSWCRALFSSPIILWEPDSQSFWLLPYEWSGPTDVTRISVVDGTILDEFTVEVDANTFEPYIPVESTREWIVNDRAASVLTDLGRIEQLSPDGTTVALPGELEQESLAYLVRLGNAAWPLRRDYTGWVAVNQENTHTDTPDLLWYDDNTYQQYLLSQPFWSNDGRKLVFSRTLPDSDSPIFANYDVFQDADDTSINSATFVYFLDTGEVSLLSIDAHDLTGDFVWAPDDSAIAQVLFSMPGGGDTTLSIVTLTGEKQEILGYRDSHESICGVTWLPHGWLQLDELQE
jgi:hypothetical protein